MAAGNIANSVNHGQYDEAERQCHTDVRHLIAADFIDNDGPGAGEDQSKGSEQFGSELLHNLPPHEFIGYCPDQCPSISIIISRKILRFDHELAQINVPLHFPFDELDAGFEILDL